MSVQVPVRLGTVQETLLVPLWARARECDEPAPVLTDPTSREILNRLDTQVQHGLDFGSGPEPVLADIFRNAGHRMATYDPFFANDPAVLERQYDFISCSETVEHFFEPAREFDRLDRLLKPGGWLGLMTCFQTDDDRFADWHYRRDPTHVVFYREETSHRIAANHGWTCEIPARNIALMHKPLRAAGT